MIPPITPENAQRALMFLRVELFAAAQRLTGESLDELRTLVRDVAMVLDVDKGFTGPMLDGLVKRLNAELLDESAASTPSGMPLDDLGKMRELGFRAGWNDRARSLAKIIDVEGAVYRAVAS